MSTWRARLAPIIAEVLLDTEGLPPEEIEEALSDTWEEGSYRYAWRGSFAARVWRNEIRRQRGLPARTKPREEALAEPLLPLWEIP